jgi:hypothetical protein
VAIGRFGPHAWQIGIIPSGSAGFWGCTTCHTPINRQELIMDNETIMIA